MRALIFFLTLTLLKSFTLAAQTSDFAFTALFMLNTNNEGFSVCESFRNHEKLTFLFHHDQTCYYKAIFEESKADSVIIKVNGNNDPFVSNTNLPEINVVEYYHNFETAKREYLKIFRRIQKELMSDPKFYKPGKFDRFDDKWSNDTSFLAKESCFDLPDFYVYKYFQIRSPLVYGTISTDLQCRQHLYLIIVSVKLN